MARPGKPARRGARSERENGSEDLQGIQSVETGLSVLNALVDAGYLYIDSRRQYARRDVADLRWVDLAALKAVA